MKRARRIIRRTLAAASVASLLLCGLFAAAWIRGRFASDFLDYGHAGGSLTFAVIDQSAFLILIRFPDSNRGWTYSSNPADPGYTARFNPTAWGKIGFFYLRQDTLRGESSRVLGVPLWLLCAVTAIAPIALVIARRRERTIHARLLSECCPQCGYDLRASSGRCPECGRGILPK